MSASTSKRRVRHKRLRKKVAGTPERPRLAVHFSERHITAQVIDDTARKTLASVHTTEAGLRSEKKGRSDVPTAAKVGKLIAERGVSGKVKKVVFDRGVINTTAKSALADAAREGGLEFKIICPLNADLRPGRIRRF
jgi:large subunit ribosomal protein L18